MQWRQWRYSLNNALIDTTYHADIIFTNIYPKKIKNIHVTGPGTIPDPTNSNNQILVGVVSSSPGLPGGGDYCGPRSTSINTFDLYTSVFYHKEWIEALMTGNHS